MPSKLPSVPKRLLYSSHVMTITPHRRKQVAGVPSRSSTRRDSWRREDVGRQVAKSSRAAGATCIFIASPEVFGIGLAGWWTGILHSFTLTDPSLTEATRGASTRSAAGGRDRVVSRHGGLARLAQLGQRIWGQTRWVNRCASTKLAPVRW